MSEMKYEMSKNGKTLQIKYTDTFSGNIFQHKIGISSYRNIYFEYQLGIFRKRVIIRFWGKPKWSL